MFHNTCNDVASWLKTVSGAQSLKWSLPTNDSTKSTLWCHLHSVEPESHGANAAQLNLNFRLRFIACPTSKKSAEQQEMLGKIAIAVQEEASAEWITQPLSPNPWLTTTHPQIASINFSMPAVWERKPKIAPLVNEAVIHQNSMHDIEGTVLGPNKKHMPYEVVRLPEYNLNTQCDNHGGFNFKNIPISIGRSLTLEVRNKTYQKTFNQKPITLRYVATEK